MSTEHQQYSTENQEAAIRSYAEARNLVIVRTYADEGKSGLRVAGRNALRGCCANAIGGSAMPTCSPGSRQPWRSTRTSPGS
jgi:DNA invertase Pin-like site-specific DNA recombinase